jgi:hypothetical protein
LDPGVKDIKTTMFFDEVERQSISFVFFDLKKPCPRSSSNKSSPSLTICRFGYEEEKYHL